MKINWAVRFKNKPWLLSFTAVMVSFVYTVLGMFGIAPRISQDMLMQAASVLLTLLAGLGVIMDPTTKSVGDSPNALTYIEPK